MSADGRKTARRPFARPIVRPSVHKDGTEACPSVDPGVVNEDERSLPEHEDDHSYTEFDLHDEMDWAEQIAQAGTLDEPAPEAHDITVVHEDERSPLEDEEDHSFTEFDIDAEIHAKLGAAPEAPVEPILPQSPLPGTTGTTTLTALTGSEADRPADPLPPHDPKAFYPEDERSPMDWEDDHSEGHITEADLDRAALQNAKPLVAADTGGSSEALAEDHEFHDEDERSHLEHEDDHSYTDFDLHDEMDWAAQLAAQAEAEAVGVNAPGETGEADVAAKACDEDHLAGVDDDARPDHHDHDDEADHSMTAFDMASEVAAKLGPAPEPAPPVPSATPTTPPPPISEHERALAARNADGLDVHEDSVWEAEPEDSGDDCIALAHSGAAPEKPEDAPLTPQTESDDALTGGIVLPPKAPPVVASANTPAAKADDAKADDTKSDDDKSDDDGPGAAAGKGGSGGGADDGTGGSGSAAGANSPAADNADSADNTANADNADSADNTADADDNDDPADRPMSLRDHLTELRKRLCRAFLCVILGFFVCMPFSKHIFTYLVDPLKRFMPSESHFIFTAPAEAFFVELKVAFVAGLFVTSPLIFYQLWAFIAPGLYKEEKLYLLPITFFSALFFIAGGAFCYLVVMPFAFEFFMSYNSELIKALPKLTETLAFVLQLLLAFGLVFELPLFVFFLARLGILTADMMRRFRRYAVLVSVIIAAILTPPDVMSQLLMAGPLLVLYEISILIAAAFGRKKKVETAATPESA